MDCSTSGLGLTAYGAASKVFGLELETLLSNPLQEVSAEMFAGSKMQLDETVG